MTSSSGYLSIAMNSAAYDESGNNTFETLPVFVLLLFLYEQFRVALAMLTVMLLAITCVLVGLWVTGTELNITSIMGMTMIVGIVTEVAIFYASEYAELPTETRSHERLTGAGAQRARAIGMTTIAAMLALLPLALGIGQGAAMLQPLAIAIIAGLIAQLPLVLVVLPALFVLFRVSSQESVCFWGTCLRCRFRYGRSFHVTPFPSVTDNFSSRKGPIPPKEHKRHSDGDR
jgi:predicted RND superfamily exporter protein